MSTDPAKPAEPPPRLKQEWESRPEPSRFATSTGRPETCVRPTPGCRDPVSDRFSPAQCPPYPLSSGHAEPQLVVPVVRGVPAPVRRPDERHKGLTPDFTRPGFHRDELLLLLRKSGPELAGWRDKPPGPHEAPGVHCFRGGVLPWCRTRFEGTDIGAP